MRKKPIFNHSIMISQSKDGKIADSVANRAGWTPHLHMLLV